MGNRVSDGGDEKEVGFCILGVRKGGRLES